MKHIVRYSNRKLYDFDSSRYVTLDEIAEAVRAGEDVQVTDKVNGADLTAATLLLAMHSEEREHARYRVERLVEILRTTAVAETF